MTEKTLIMPVPPEYMWTEDHVEALTQLLLEVDEVGVIKTKFNIPVTLLNKVSADRAKGGVFTLVTITRVATLTEENKLNNLPLEEKAKVLAALISEDTYVKTKPYIQQH